MGFIKINEIIVMKYQQLGLVCFWTYINASYYYLLWLPRVWQGSLVEVFVMREVIPICAVLPLWLLSTWKVAGATEELNLSFRLIFIHFNWNIHIWLVANVLNSACWVVQASSCPLHILSMLMSYPTVGYYYLYPGLDKSKGGCETRFWQVGMVA